MRKSEKFRSMGIAIAGWMCLAALVWFVYPQEVQEKQQKEEIPEIQALPIDTAPLLAPRQAVRAVVPSNQEWMDTGYRVLAGQEIQFQASGVISLQKGNPIAFPCTPDGLSLKTVQQPVRDENLGALVGKIVLLVAIEVDEKTGEETRFVEERFFYIGSRNRISMSLSGRLYLGVNELVVIDNEGTFEVVFFLR